MKKVLTISLTGLYMVLTADAQAVLDNYRSSTPCNLRASADCKNAAVFMRDARDKCIGDPTKNPSKCLVTFCTTNCALPAHQAISDTAKPLCEQYCAEIDLMNHRLQENLVTHVQGALSEEAAQERYPQGRERDNRNKKEEANFNSAYGGMIAQLKKAGWDRVNDAEKLKYYRYQAKEAQKDFEAADELWKQTEKSLQENGFSEEEIKAFRADSFAAEQKLKRTPSKDIQIGSSKAAKQLYDQVTSIGRKKSPQPTSSDAQREAEREIELDELLDDGTGAGI